jgi:hypothetical protein
MTARAAFFSLDILAGCATAARDPAPDANAPATSGAASRAVPTARPAVSPGPSDWALAVIGTPFVFAFRVVACAATAVVAAPTAGLLTLTPDPKPGLAYLRDGLGHNCGPPYGMPVPVAAGYRPKPDIDYYVARHFQYYPEPGISYYPAPDIRPYPVPEVGGPRPLTPYSAPSGMVP